MKLCKDCKHAVIMSTGGYLSIDRFPQAAMCIITQRAATNPVNGKITMTTMNYCEGERENIQGCGPEGRFFEEKEK